MVPVDPNGKGKVQTVHRELINDELIMVCIICDMDVVCLRHIARLRRIARIPRITQILRRRNFVRMRRYGDDDVMSPPPLDSASQVIAHLAKFKMHFTVLKEF